MRPSLRTLVLALSLALASACSAGSSTDPIPAGTPGECARCHLPEFQSSAQKHHAGKPPVCKVCHAEDRWKPSRLNHVWKLDGAHADTECLKCHLGSPPVFVGNDKACVACHRKDYEKARNHEHRPTTCDDCHSTTKWKPAHEKKTDSDDDDE
jgi:hypothetical protein